VLAYSSPGFGGSRWPWRGAGVDENWRRCRSNDVEEPDILDSCCKHSDILPFAPSVPRGAAVLTRLENLRKLDNAHVGRDGIPSDHRKALTQVRLEAILPANTRKGVREANEKELLHDGCTAIIPKSVRRQELGPRCATNHLA
jgi:hypothetical protein